MQLPNWMCVSRSSYCMALIIREWVKKELVATCAEEIKSSCLLVAFHLWNKIFNNQNLKEEKFTPTQFRWVQSMTIQHQGTNSTAEWQSRRILLMELWLENRATGGAMNKNTPSWVEPAVINDLEASPFEQHFQVWILHWSDLSITIASLPSSHVPTSLFLNTWLLGHILDLYHSK